MAETLATIKTLKPGRYIVIDDEPCIVSGLVKSKPGKHGAAKVRLEAVGIFDGKKRFVLKPADTTVEVPVIEKRNGQVVSVTGTTAQLMDLEDYSMFDANIPDEFRGKLDSGKEVVYWRWKGRILIKQLK
jgi:translation initiation factor 5A